MRTRPFAVSITVLITAVGITFSLSPAPAHEIIGPDGTPQKHWVRYPFEFQLCGIGLGDKALDREAGNYLLRYCLFRVHGNPTAVVVGSGGLAPSQTPPGGVGGAGGEGGGMAGGPMGGGGPMGAGMGGGPMGGGAMGGGAMGGGPGMGGEMGGMGGPGGGGGGPGGGQQAQGLSAGGPAPAWALAAWVAVDENHCEWLYYRSTYTMGFVVDRLGFIDQIVVAGTQCPIAATQLNDPQHRIRLGDDVQRVLLRYGYPDDIETYVSSGGGGGGGLPAGAGGGGGGAAAGGPGGMPGGGEGGMMGPMGPGGGSGMGGEMGGMGGEGGMMGPGGPGGMTGGPMGGGGPGGGGGGGGGPSLSFSGGGGGGAGLSGSVSFQGVTNQLRRTYIFYYHDSYNVIFTLRDNKVVRINIFGDPDHFNRARREYYRNNY